MYTVYAFGSHVGRWNDITCGAKRSCVCQDPRGQVHGGYVSVNGERTYDEASLYCKQKYGTTLATIESESNNQEVLEACRSILGAHGVPHCWIGLQRPFMEWDDGTNAEEKFDNWFPGEPNNKNEECTEMYAEHRGLWNDLGCHAKRYFVCNAKTKIQRMDFQKREEMIANRMARHKMKWQAYQTMAYRRKVRKQFFEKMKARQREIRAHQRKMQQRQREYMRQMSFNKMMGRMNQRSAGMMMGGGGYGFRANSVFGDRMDNNVKRRRLREGIMRGYENKKWRERADKMKDEMERVKERNKDKAYDYEMDEGDLYEEEEKGVRSGKSYEEWRQMRMEGDRLINPTPKRCIMFTYDTELYELCINDDFVFIRKYMEKVKKPGYDFEVDVDYIKSLGLKGNDTVLDEVMDGNMSIVHDYDDMMDLERYENYKYMQAVIHDYDKNEGVDDEYKGIEIKKFDEKPSFLRIDEFIYNFEKNHKRQCYKERYPYDICLEYDDIEDDMILYYGLQNVYNDEYINYHSISFKNDVEWIEIETLITENNDDGEFKIKKCFIYGDSKICLINNDETNNSNEYRALIMTKLKESFEDEDDPSNFEFFQ